MADDIERVDPSAPAAWWLDQLEDAERAQKDYHDRCDKVDDVYSHSKEISQVLAPSKCDDFPIFWANLEVLKPSIYARPPAPVAQERFRDRNPVVRRAADLLERALSAHFDLDDVHGTLVLVRDDLAINARGVPWLTLVERDGITQPSWKHVQRKDFKHEPARNWREVEWVARCTWETKRSLEQRFPKVAKGDYKITYQTQEIGDFKGDDKAPIWNIWHKRKKTVVWVSPGCPEILEEREPWIDLQGFFPCPQPAYGTLQRGTLVPVPDLMYYADQVNQINLLTARIHVLSATLRLRAFYPGGSPELTEAIERAIQEVDDRAIAIPIPGIPPTAKASDFLMFLPIEEIANTISVLVQQRRVIIDDVYQITGLSDIMRGATDATETATAQQLKAQYGSVRVRDRQNEMIRVARDMVRMTAEAMAEQMDVQDLLRMAQVDDLPSEQDLMAQAQPILQQAQSAMQQLVEAAATGQIPPEQAQQQGEQLQQQAQQQLDQIKQTVTVEKIGKLLQDQRVRPFALDIETDSTVEPDQQAMKERAVEFAGAIGPMMQQAMVALTQAGSVAQPLGEFFAEGLRFTANAFKSDRRMDDAIDKLAEGMATYQPPPPPQKGEDPAVAQAKAQGEQVKAQAAQAKAQADVQVAQVNQQTAGLKLQAEQAKAQMGQLEAEQTSVETEKLRAEIMKIMQEIRMAPAEMAMERQEGMMKMQMDAKAQADDSRRQDEQMRADVAQRKVDNRRADKQMAFDAKEAQAARKDRAAAKARPAAKA